MSTIGAFALVGAWIAGDSGTFLGYAQLHLYWDALNLQLIGIAAALCALYRRRIEEKSPGQLL